MSTSPHPTSEYPDSTPINLNRLLLRLEHTVLSSDASSSLRTSSYERAKVRANVEHARTLLLNLEHTAATQSTTKSRKTAFQSDLQSKRELIKQLNQRLYELDQLDDSNSDGSADSDDEDDLLPSYAPRLAADAGIESQPAGAGNEALQEAARNISSELRSRKGQAQNENKATAATGTSLFSAQSNKADPKLQHTEALLSHNRTEQETLTNSLVAMAQQLKQQSVHFGQTLESDKGVLDRAVEGLDKNQLGMEAAGQRMGALRRMTEGQGWWGRMKLYALIFGLWVACFLIFFVGPKIRL